METWILAGLLTLLSPSMEEQNPPQRVLELTVKECVTRALQNNPNLSALQFAAEAQLAAIQQSWGSFDPTLSANYSYSGSRSRATGFVDVALGVSQRTSRSHDGSVTLGQTILTGGSYNLTFSARRNEDSTNLTFFPERIGSATLTFSQPLLKGAWTQYNKANVHSAKLSHQMAEQDLDSNIIATINDVHAAYWDLVFALEDVKVKEFAVTLAQELFDINQKKVDEGVSAPVEVLQAETEVALRKQELITAKNLVNASEDTLRQLIFPFQTPQDWQFSITPTSTPMDKPLEKAPTWEQAIHKALKARPDLKRGRLDVEVKKIAVEVADNELLPSLNLEGSRTNFGSGGSNPAVANTNYSDIYKQIRGSDFTSYRVSMNLDVPIGNRAAKGKLRAAKANYSASLQTLKILENNVAREVRDALRLLTFTKEQMNATAKSSQLAKQQLDAEQRKFDVGLSTNFEVLNLQKEYSQALSNEKRAVLEHQKAITNLSKVQGILRP